MWCRQFRGTLCGICVLVGIGFWCPVAQAQTSDESDVQIIEPPPGGISPDEKRPDKNQSVALILSLTNQFRNEQRQRQLTPNDELNATAQDFANYMAQTDRYGHNADGRGPSDRVKQHGYQYCIIAENIAAEYSSEGFETEELANKFINAWKASPGHRKNMLDPDVYDIGVGLAYSARTDHYYAVQLFGRSGTNNIEFSINNGSRGTVKYELGGQVYSIPPRYTRTHQICRPSDLTFLWRTSPESRERNQTLQVASGARYRIVQDDAGRLHAETE